MTPYELGLAVQGYTKRKEREAEEYQIKYENERKLLTIQAYLISRWVWQKKVDIDKILNTDVNKPKKNMTDDEMLAQVKVLNALFGGEIKNGSEK